MAANTVEERESAEGIVQRAMVEVSYKYNAYAPILSSFRIAYSDMLPTMGVDKYARLTINPKFAIENQAYINGILIHEVLHVFFGHTTDTRSKLAYTENAWHNRMANIAEDCAINQFILEQLPDGAITPSTLSKALGGVRIKYNECAEYYYDKIVENTPKDKQGNGDKQEENGDEQGEGGTGNGDGGSILGNGMCSTDIANTQKIQDALDKMGIEHISQEEVNDSVLRTAQEICKSHGDGYGGLIDFARELMEPKVDWRPLLQSAVKSAEKKAWNIRARSTYKRMNRRYATSPIIMPKKYGHKISAVLSFDTSGSISPEMVNQFLSEVQNAMKFAEIKECALWHTKPYWYGTPQELEKNVEKIFESGGTDEACMGQVEKHCKADLYIHFSDGYHGDNYGFEHPQKHIEILWEGKDIKEIRKEF